MLCNKYLLLLLLFSVSATNAAQVYRYWDWGQSPKRDAYQLALLESALEVTRDSHGPYQLVRVAQEFSTSRARREINKAKLINIRTGPYLPPGASQDKNEENHPIKVPILFNLLGHQRLIIRANDIDCFRRLDNLLALADYQVGLGRGWADVDIYRHNGFRVSDIAHVTSLVSMLQQGRFDFLPATLMDYREAIASSETAEQLAVVPDTVVSFWFPVVFYVGKGNLHLAERIETGLNLLQQHGGMQDLFRQHFAAEIEFLRREGLKFITLENPYHDPSLSMSSISAKGTLLKEDSSRNP
ncbi:hypothetical protein [Gilvimarinus sp. DA14]|uniref:hypothetical protein n=1 Tax=Gilvimarinus sp. DA14 TaxID=2956798 RepID=UPI0020B70716|nr:hypothetical protein [Gilvimarinus sp. DA14]UTF61453.1 hypothetical protein NHM04_06555 [Gilvimarinus sp. DA14]